MPSSSRKSNQRSQPSDEDHPVFSDFSHISTLGNVSFAVGLRDENGAKNIERILPMTKHIPARPVAPRNIQKKASKKSAPVEEEQEVICQRPDCSARRLRLADLQQENEHLRAQFKIIENKIIASKHKKALADKTIAATEEKNDNVRAQIDETQGRMEGIQAEIGLCEIGNQKLREKLATLESEIEVLREQAEKDAEVMRNLQSRSVEEMVFSAKKDMTWEKWQDVEEVKTLRVRGATNDDDDYDSDN
jgi:chromosome segregation ATPase